jgi:hypothetical protein
VQFLRSVRGLICFLSDFVGLCSFPAQFLWFPVQFVWSVHDLQGDLLQVLSPRITTFVVSIVSCAISFTCAWVPPFPVRHRLPTSGFVRFLCDFVGLRAVFLVSCAISSFSGVVSSVCARFRFLRNFGLDEIRFGRPKIRARKRAQDRPFQPFSARFEGNLSLKDPLARFRPFLARFHRSVRVSSVSRAISCACAVLSVSSATSAACARFRPFPL